MVVSLGPVDEHFQVVEAYFLIAVRGLCLLLSIDAYIDFIQLMLRQGNRVAVAQNGIAALALLVFV